MEWENLLKMYGYMVFVKDVWKLVQAKFVIE